MRLSDIIKNAYEKGWEDRGSYKGPVSYGTKPYNSKKYSSEIVSYIETDPSQLKMDLR